MGRKTSPFRHFFHNHSTMQVNRKNQPGYEGFRGESPLDLGRRLYDPRPFQDVAKCQHRSRFAQRLHVRLGKELF